MTVHEQYRDDLPLLAAGVLSAEEATALQQHVDSCAECAAELTALAEAASQIALARGGVRPPFHLRKRILDQIRLPKQKKQFWPAWLWVPAAAALVFAVLWVYELSRARDLENQLAEARSSNQAIQRGVEDALGKIKNSRALFETLSSPDALHVTLVATGKTGPPEAKTIYSSKQHALVLTANNLPTLAPHKAYQLWLLTARGEKVPYGTFKPDGRGNAVMLMTALEPQTPSGFAVTIENESGSKSPTTSPVLVGTL